MSVPLLKIPRKSEPGLPPWPYRADPASVELEEFAAGRRRAGGECEDKTSVMMVVFAGGSLDLSQA